MQVNIDEKLDTLFSFLKTHQKNKCIVFFSSCKQVRFAYEAFRRLKVGVQLLELHGRQKQSKRTAIYFEFVERKHSVLFCTDIASRGIDFPAVDWVIQYDTPEDVYTYIHRVGRTARYKSKGNSLLFLTPSELKFVERVDKRNISLKKINANPNKALTIQPTLQKLNAENPEVKHLAEKACISYIKSIYLMKDKEVFRFNELPTDKLAFSLGLANAPQIGFVKKVAATTEVALPDDQPAEKKVSRL
jgi:ATP-dependent RNA helicase DDX10/DBP4